MKNAKIPGYCFYININIYGDLQICISAPTTKNIALTTKNISKEYNEDLPMS